MQYRRCDQWKWPAPVAPITLYNTADRQPASGCLAMRRTQLRMDGSADLPIHPIFGVVGHFHFRPLCLRLGPGFVAAVAVHTADKFLSCDTFSVR